MLATAVFAMIYKTMPRVGIDWNDVWVGAVVTSLLFIAGKFLIGAYIGGSGISSGFGAAASLIVVLLWVYYSAQIFLFGAEFTWVYSHKFGSRRGQASHRCPRTTDWPGLNKQEADKCATSMRPRCETAKLPIGRASMHSCIVSHFFNS